MTLRNVISAVEQTIQTAGYARAPENFTLDRVPASSAHCSYTLGRLEIRPRYLGSGVADYLGARLPLLILFRVHGPHNASGSFAEAYLDVLDAYQELESALVSDQLQESGENNAVEFAVLQPLLSTDSQEYLLLSITLALDVMRHMNT